MYADVCWCMLVYADKWVWVCAGIRHTTAPLWQRVTRAALPHGSSSVIALLVVWAADRTDGGACHTCAQCACGALPLSTRHAPRLCITTRLYRPLVFLSAVCFVPLPCCTCLYNLGMHARTHVSVCWGVKVALSTFTLFAGLGAVALPLGP